MNDNVLEFLWSVPFLFIECIVLRNKEPFLKFEHYEAINLVGQDLT